MNRNDKFDEASKVYRDFESSFAWGASMFRDSRYTDPTKLKIEKQYEYTFEKLKSFETNVQTANRISLFRYMMFLSLLALTYMVMTGQISFEFTKSNSKENDEESNV